MPRAKDGRYLEIPYRAKKDKLYVLSFTNGRCYYCNIELTEGVKWQVEHLIPLSPTIGGKDKFTNIAAACFECNRLKGKRTPEEFKELILNMVSGKLKEALEATETLKRYTAPEETLNQLREVINRAIEMDMKITMEMNPSMFPGEPARKQRIDYFKNLGWKE